MIMQSISLADDVRLYKQEERITLGVDVPGLAADKTNLAYRAAALIKDTYGIKLGAHIELVKKIPMAAGLAGGSADAAAVLKGLNRLWNLKLTMSELEKLGADLGSDIPFCLNGGTMMAEGRGEKLSPLSNMPKCYVVLAKLPINVSTAWVYGHYRADRVLDHPDIEGMKKCLKDNDLATIAAKLGNVLESVTIPAYPKIANIKQCMLENGAMNSLMSGSGPTVFGLVEGRDQAEHIAAQLKKHSDARVIIAQSVQNLEGENG
jgi:4-diphosphocytidyl-2-C-methyl-D-erythritol kinase